jgi:hypothetical protein
MLCLVAGAGTRPVHDGSHDRSRILYRLLEHETLRISFRIVMRIKFFFGSDTLSRWYRSRLCVHPCQGTSRTLPTAEAAVCFLDSCADINMRKTLVLNR